MTLIDKVWSRDLLAIARAISMAENDAPEKEELVDALFLRGGKAMVLGITGPPGAGKSTLVDQLITRFRNQGKRIAVIAVDPSSPFSGGAILGDRLRMQAHATDDQVFIRSMASRGHLGGLARATGDAIKIFDAAGYDVILIETIGVGQTEIEISGLADMVLLILVPGMGDEIQVLKAGIMEIGDIFVINKSDKPEARKLAAEIEYVLGLGDRAQTNPIVMTSALLNQGIDELENTIASFYTELVANGRLQKRKRQRLLQELQGIIRDKMESKIREDLAFESELDGWLTALSNHSVAPYALVREKMGRIFNPAEGS
jgi:LAO/AO transport system kinase